MSSVSNTPSAYGDLVQLQWRLSQAHSEIRFEILRGQVVAVAPPRPKHERIALRVLQLCMAIIPDGLEYFPPNSGVFINRTETEPEWCQPDGMVVIDRRAEDRIIGTEVVLAIEVLSPTNLHQPDYRISVIERAVRFGIGWVAFVDPDQRDVGIERAAATGEQPSWFSRFQSGATEIVRAYPDNP